MSGHTPGPWTTVGRVVKAGGANVAHVTQMNGDSDERVAANARLLAAAPTLRAELNHAAAMLAIAATEVRTVEYDGERFDLLAEAERFDAQLRVIDGEKVAA